MIVQYDSPSAASRIWIKDSDAAFVVGQRRKRHRVIEARPRLPLERIRVRMHIVEGTVRLPSDECGAEQVGGVHRFPTNRAKPNRHSSPKVPGWRDSIAQGDHGG